MFPGKLMVSHGEQKPDWRIYLMLHAWTSKIRCQEGQLDVPRESMSWASHLMVLIHLIRRDFRCSKETHAKLKAHCARWLFQTFLIFTPILGEMIQFDDHTFQMGWFNHQIVCYCYTFTSQPAHRNSGETNVQPLGTGNFHIGIEINGDLGWDSGWNGLQQGKQMRWLW